MIEYVIAMQARWQKYPMLMVEPYRTSKPELDKETLVKLGIYHTPALIRDMKFKPVRFYDMGDAARAAARQRRIQYWFYGDAKEIGMPETIFSVYEWVDGSLGNKVSDLPDYAEWKASKEASNG